MANHMLLYSRPLSADDVVTTMTITGDLSNYVLAEAYESRLQVNNGVGRLTLEVVSQSLPAGASVRIDNITDEVVVKWEAFTEVEEPISLVPNGNFEAGDDGSWMYGPGGGGQGWSIGTGSDYATYDGTHSARFANYKGGSDINLLPLPAKVNDYIRAKAMVQQGGSSSGKAAASVHLYFLDATFGRLAHFAGNNVSSGSNGEWKASEVEGAAPAGTAFVQLSISAYRNKQNLPLWVDTVTWDHKYTMGQDEPEEYSLTVKVTDSENRVAYWSGTINVFLKSRLLLEDGSYFLMEDSGNILLED